MKKTAVDWLFDQIPTGYKLTRDGYEAYTIAKEMEKQQIKEAYYRGDYDTCVAGLVSGDDECEQYYNETYGGER